MRLYDSIHRRTAQRVLFAAVIALTALSGVSAQTRPPLADLVPRAADGDDSAMEWLTAGVDQRSNEENEALKASLKSEFDRRRGGKLEYDVTAEEYAVVRIVPQVLPAQEALLFLTEELLDLTHHSDAYVFADSADEFRIQDDLESCTLLAQHLANLNDTYWYVNSDVYPSEGRRDMLKAIRNGLSHCGLPGLEALKQVEGLVEDTYFAISRNPHPEAIQYLIDQYKQSSHEQKALNTLASKYWRVTLQEDKDLIFSAILDLLYEDSPGTRARGARFAGMTRDLRFMDVLADLASSDPATDTRDVNGVDVTRYTVRERAATALEKLKSAESRDYGIASTLLNQDIPDLERELQRLLQNVEDGIDVERSLARIKTVTRLLERDRERLEALQSTLEGQ